jgi:hypothetical protein
MAPMATYPMGNPRWFCYSKVPAILLPVSIARHWRGFYLPVRSSKKHPDLVIGDARFRIDPGPNLKHPKTDLDRAWVLLANPPEVQMIDVGPGFGLIFGADQDFVSWWANDLLLLIGGPVLKKELSKMGLVEWSDQLVWQTKEREFVLMNSCEHGANPKNEEQFTVHLKPGEYVLQYGWYGWDGPDPALHLFRFVSKEKPSASKQRMLSRDHGR